MQTNTAFQKNQNARKSPALAGGNGGNHRNGKKPHKGFQRTNKRDLWN